MGKFPFLNIYKVLVPKSKKISKHANLVGVDKHENEAEAPFQNN